MTAFQCLCQGEILGKSSLKTAEISHSSCTNPSWHQAQEPACSYRKQLLLSLPLLLYNEMFSLMALASWNQRSEEGKTQNCCFSGNFLLHSSRAMWELWCYLSAKSCSKGVTKIGILGSNGYFGIFFSLWRPSGMSSAFLIESNRDSLGLQQNPLSCLFQYED